MTLSLSHKERNQERYLKLINKILDKIPLFLFKAGRYFFKYSINIQELNNFELRILREFYQFENYYKIEIIKDTINLIDYYELLPVKRERYILKEIQDLEKQFLMKNISEKNFLKIKKSKEKRIEELYIEGDPILNHKFNENYDFEKCNGENRPHLEDSDSIICFKCKNFCNFYCIEYNVILNLPNGI